MYQRQACGPRELDVLLSKCYLPPMLAVRHRQECIFNIVSKNAHDLSTGFSEQTLTLLGLPESSNS
jgi:hypothetical protein